MRERGLTVRRAFLRPAPRGAPAVASAWKARAALPTVQPSNHGRRNAAQSTHRKESVRSKSLATRIASFALAALMTVGMLGGIDDFAKVETRLGAANALIAQAAQIVGRA